MTRPACGFKDGLGQPGVAAPRLPSHTVPGTHVPFLSSLAHRSCKWLTLPATGCQTLRRECRFRGRVITTYSRSWQQHSDSCHVHCKTLLNCVPSYCAVLYLLVGWALLQGLQHQLGCPALNLAIQDDETLHSSTKRV